MTTPPTPPSGFDPMLAEPVLAETVPDAVVVAETAERGERRDRWLDNPWFILGLLCFVTLFLGFPFLWKSRGFSKLAKVVVTILVSIETVLVFWAFFAIMKWCWQQISDSL